MSKITQRIQSLQAEIPPEVILMAVSKYAPIDAMREAYGAGLRHFGESKVQDMVQKQTALQDLPGITWHMIGHLQRNKVRPALKLFDWIHGVDRISLAEYLNHLLPHQGDSPQLCLQVKLAPDPDKFGWDPRELLAEAATLRQLTNLNVVGLMTILPQGVQGEEAFQLFTQIHPLRQALVAAGFALPHLSMGMSGDYLEAIRAGATIVRVGRQIFG